MIRFAAEAVNSFHHKTDLLADIFVMLSLLSSEYETYAVVKFLACLDLDQNPKF